MAQFPSTVAGLPLHMGRTLESLDGSAFAVIDAYGRTETEMMQDLKTKFNALPERNGSGTKKSDVGWITSMYETVGFNGKMQDNQFYPMCPPDYSKQ
jgi:hypothetical protein